MPGKYHCIIKYNYTSCSSMQVLQVLGLEGQISNLCIHQFWILDEMVIHINLGILMPALKF